MSKPIKIEKIKRDNENVKFTAITERLARAALQASKKLEEAIARDSRWSRHLVDGAVVQFDHEFPAKFAGDRDGGTYRYVAIRLGEKWYLSGSAIRRAMSDEEFMEFVGDAGMLVATEWEQA